jgi:hypothetical protein
MGLSQKQISEIIKQADPDHWLNRLPQDKDCFELELCMICPPRGFDDIIGYRREIKPMRSFFKEEDATFIQNKCYLLIEMSNFAFSVNQNWYPDWNDKEMKKYGIVLQNGQAVVKENELFNVFVGGIVTSTLSLAREMLDEFKDSIEEYFNAPYNRISPVFETPEVLNDYSSEFESNEPKITDVETMFANVPDNLFFKPELEENQEISSKRKKVKFLREEDVPKIQQMLIDKVQQKQIAKVFGYSNTTISLLKRRLGFKMIQRTRIPKEDGK